MARRPVRMANIEATLARMEPEFRRAFEAAVADVTSTAQLQTITGHLADGNIEAAALAVKLDPRFFAPLDRAIESAYLIGGADALAGLPRIADPFGDGPLVLRFDGRHPRAERWVKDRSSTLIREIVTDQRETIRTTLRAGLEAGRNPRSVALDIVGRVDRATGRRTGGVIGLTNRQASYVANARAELASGDPATMKAYFARTLRDKRYDATVLRAIREGRPVASADIDRIVGRYNDRLLKHRGDTIARTESITALRAGRHEGFEQLVETGAVQRSQVVRKWDATLDKRTRDDHAAMHGAAVEGMDAPFVLPDGSRMMYPGDTSLGADAAQTINCRCVERVEIDFLAGVD